MIISNQHGFVPGKSVSSNLLEYSHYISDNLSGNTQVDSIYLDLTKAFDRLNHQILLDKLNGYGILGSLHKWFASYLLDRTCVVRVGSAFSRPFSAISGDPILAHCSFSYSSMTFLVVFLISMFSSYCSVMISNSSKLLKATLII